MADVSDRRTGLTSAAMEAVLEVTGDSVRVRSGFASATPPSTLVEAALDWIDDPVGLLDERPVAVADLWRSLMVALVGDRCASVLVVHPPDWPRHRVDRVVAAANAVADHVGAVRRDRWTAEMGVARRDPLDVGRSERRHLRTAAISLLTVAAVAVPAGVAATVRTGPPETPDATVVEGRLTARIPAHWRVERVTGGPGSRRLQISAPGDPGIAVHLTSAYAPESTLEQAAAMLRTAIADEPLGVFVDLDPVDEVAGRAAVTYREVRPGRVIAWSVVLSGATRISIGCQSPPGRAADVRTVCDGVVRTARET